MPTATETPATILNVDDHEAGRYATTRVLQEARFRVREAATGGEALRIVREDRPDLVLLDVNLPDINGMEVCRRIKADPATARIPVLHLSATAVRGADRKRGLDAGAETYLVEPVEPEVLVATIKALLRTRQVEESIARMAREWQATFDAMSEGVAVLDREGRVVRSNAAMGQLFGATQSGLIGRDIIALWNQQRVPGEKLAFHRMLVTGKREEMDVEAGGAWLHVTSDPLRDDSGRISGAVYVISDVTARRRLEEQIRQAQKIEAIGHLAGGVAHDYNNLLTSILGNASLALTELPPSSPAQDKLSEILRAGERAADLTRQLLAYSGRGHFVVRKMDPGDTMREIEPVVRSFVPAAVDLTLRMEPHLPWIDADPRQMHQVLINLVRNAVEAVGEKAGRIEITASACRLGKDSGTRLPPGEYVRIVVKDTGCGMDAETRARIFDPFFSTKFTGRGMGLAAVDGIVRAHRGAIEVESAPGRGSTFGIYFPAVERPQPAAEPAQPLKAAETVLVVDDEDMIRRLARAALEAAGYQVLLAGDGRQAVELVRRHGENISVMLLDLTMPVLDGARALAEIDRIRPGIKVIVSTGYDRREAFHRFSRDRVEAFLQKPYTASLLTAKVKSALEKKR